jgi:hypothetical protein
MEFYLHYPNTPSWHGALLRKKHRENVPFTFYLRGKLPLFILEKAANKCKILSIV